jgi:hypothetical protein
MHTDKIVVILVWLFCVAAWAMNIWGGWAESVVAKASSKKYIWYWMRILRLEQTKENQIRFIKMVSIFGIIVVSVCSILEVLFFPIK